MRESALRLGVQPRAAALAAIAVAVGACAPAAKTPAAPRRPLAASFVAAQLAEQEKTSDLALAAMLDVVDASVAEAPARPESFEACAAALDAIAFRRTVGLDLSGREALAFRTSAGVATAM
ncbi:MAG TPA: hypothetical protein PLI95_13995, partial [Polyangiaceae bacterium]|nr:hypothetical protein [Polyangiaceae bacterium]